jgi:hypothetical protein
MSIVSRRVNAHAVALLAVSGSALAVPGLVYAASGGAGLGGSGGKASQVSSASGQVQPANVAVSASGGGITVRTLASAILRQPTKFTGTIGPSGAGETVEIQRKGRETNWRWANTAHDTASSSGSFTAVWPTNHIGEFAIRAVIVSSGASRVSPSLTITVFRPAIATQYGPGFYGSRTACGQVLKKGTIGTANRTLRCGTPVAIYYNGKKMIVPVIDRGPYANHADWDLTTATAKAMGIPGTATIGAVSLPKAS